MPVYNRLTDRSQVSAVTVNDIFHVVVTGDTSQSPQGSSYYAPISFLQPILSGASGTHGTSGTSGSSGSSGTSGANGSSGTSGANGSSGTSGANGSSGSSGTSGTRGSSGSSGTNGSSGSSGTSGGQGVAGTSGSSGSAGTSGVSFGTSGTSGESGSSGTSGTQGAAGSSGSSGTSGANGTSGSSGTSGTRGSSGSTGTSGTSGTSPLPSEVNTIQNTGNTKFFITFVDSNNLVATPESVYTNTGISYNPSTDILELISGYQSGDGTVSAPPYSFIADTNTGIYRIGTDHLGITTGGVRRMSADSTGRILMGNGDETNGANFIFPLGAYVATSNATPTTLLTLATVADAVYTVEAFVVGGRDSGVNAIGGIISATFINDSGVLGLIGTVQGSVQENFAAGPTFTLTTSGTNIILQVTGVVGININWYGKIKYITGSFAV